MKVSLRYYNQVYNMYLTTTSTKEFVETNIDATEHGDFRLSKYLIEGIPYYTYGYRSLNNPPLHGGEWSSNPETIYAHFGIKLMDVSLDGRAAALTLDRVMSLVNPAIYKLGPFPMLGLQSDVLPKTEFAGYDQDGAEEHMFTNEEKLHMYEIILQMIPVGYQRGTYFGICDHIRTYHVKYQQARYGFSTDSKIMYDYPELWEYKPKGKPAKGYWWPKGSEERLQVIKDIIAKLERKEA